MKSVSGQSEMKLSVEKWNNEDQIVLITLSNSSGMKVCAFACCLISISLLMSTYFFKVQVINYGCIIVSVRVPDRNGKLSDVVLGCIYSILVDIKFF